MSGDPQGSVNSDSPTVQIHLSILQSVIQRMAENSSSAKTWCITLVSATLVLIVEKEKPSLFWVSAFPIVSFGALDIYYLSLEKRFRQTYEEFIGKLHKNELVSADLFEVTPASGAAEYHIESLRSFSIWGFYLSQAIMLLIMWYCVG